MDHWTENSVAVIAVQALALCVDCYLLLRAYQAGLHLSDIPKCLNRSWRHIVMLKKRILHRKRTPRL